MVSEITPGEHAVTLYALTRDAYTLEAERIGCADFPPLRETVEQLRASPDRFLIFRRSGNTLGALSFVCAAGGIVISRLVVSPAHLRQGIATSLLAELERLTPQATIFSVSTAEANVPAITLYRSLGYIVARTSCSPEGIALLHFEKSRANL